MREHGTADGYATGLILVVIGFSLACLALGWGIGIEWLIRFSEGRSAMVPGTALCLILIAFSSLPAHTSRFRTFQSVSLVAGLLILGAMTVSPYVADRAVDGWLFAERSRAEGVSGASIVGLLLAGIAPAVRLRLLPLPGEWQFHAPLFGLVIAVVFSGLIAFDPYTFETIAVFQHLSLNTALSLSALFGAQVLLHHPDEVTDMPGRTFR